MAPIYLDNHATTPVDPRVFEAMRPYFTEKFGNAASRQHAFGREAESAAEEARAQTAALIHARSSEIVFTSGATESDNLAIRGAMAAAEGRDHVVTAATEHRAVLESCAALEREGKAKVTILPVGSDGRIDLEDLKKTITDRTALVSIMLANNEIGVLQPVAEIGRICRERGVLFHTDAAQGCGKVPVDVEAMNIDLLSFTAHKMYGPKGVGALYVRSRNPRVKLSPVLVGGSQEQGLRPGTLAVPLVVGFGKACALARLELPVEAKRILELRERLRRRIFENIDHVVLNGSLEHRVPGNLNVSFAYVEGGRLVEGMGDVAVSSGAACLTAKIEPSYVLQAIGVDEALSASTIRFGLGRFTTEAEVDVAWERLKETVARLRAESPLYPTKPLLPRGDSVKPSSGEIV